MKNTANHHSQEFVAEMKLRLEEEQKTLIKELNSLGEGKGVDYESDFPEYGRSDEQNAAEIADYQASTSTVDTLEERLVAVKQALQNIADGAYGVTASGELIPEDRLRANPAAATVIEK